MAFIDVDQLAAEALEQFARHGDREAAGNIARRKMFSIVADLRKQGKIKGDKEVQQYLKKLDHLIQTLTIPDRKINDHEKITPAKAPRDLPDFADLKTMVASVFRAPVDGSKERARVLAERAHGLVNEHINRSGLDFFERRKLRKAMKEFIREQTEAISND